MNTLNRFHPQTGRRFAAVFLAIVCAALPVSAESGKQRKFATPDEAIQALREAAKAKDHVAMREIFGPRLHELMTGDEVQDRANFEKFSQAVDTSCKPQPDGENQVTLEIGPENWPFPIPLVQKRGQWFFDTDAGIEEIVNRHVGRGELNAIAVCRDYVEAQKKYFSKDRDGSGVMKYAQKLQSSPGRKDGLYWEKGDNEEGGPLKRLIAEAREEGYGTNQTVGSHAFHGYYFKILTVQGPAAPGGRESYVENGAMTKGFALVAYPEKWGHSGIMTFIVNQDGKVYQRNFRERTTAIAGKMVEYNPDRKWKLEEDTGIADE
jgi:hypothetical protein